MGDPNPLTDLYREGGGGGGGSSTFARTPDWEATCCAHWLFVVAVFRYFFPTYENDTLLCSLEDDEDEDDDDDERKEEATDNIRNADQNDT